MKFSQLLGLEFFLQHYDEYWHTRQSTVWNISLNRKLFGHKTGSTNRHSWTVFSGLYSEGKFSMIWRTVFKSQTFFFFFFFFFLKVCTETIKNKHYLLKINISKITSRFYQNQKRTLNCFPDFAVGLKRVWSVCHRSYWYQTKFHFDTQETISRFISILNYFKLTH